MCSGVFHVQLTDDTDDVWFSDIVAANRFNAADLARVQFPDAEVLSVVYVTHPW